MRYTLFLFLLCQFGFSQEIPEPLKPWRDWVLTGHEEAMCTHPFNQPGINQCSWPGRLRLKINDTGSFAQNWRLQVDTKVPLPGGPGYWPQQVRVNGKPHAVTAHKGKPVVHLPKGRHSITGRWTEPNRPGSVSVPPLVGLIELETGGRRITSPRRDSDGTLWLEQAQTEKRDQDSHELHVARLFEDNLPFSMTVHFKLNLSGKSRELVVGKPLPPGFTALSMQTPLPARFDSDGNLILQARAGAWELRLTAVADTPPSSLTFPESTGIMPPMETWCYLPNRQLRRVAVSGLPMVDPNQSILPEEWKQYATYSVSAGGELILEERERGFTSLSTGNFELDRELWLDFDGAGFSFKDSLTGTLEQNQRLSLASPYQPGRILVNDQERLITKDAANNLPGVSLRSENVYLEAEGRIEARTANLPSLGWDFPVKSIQTDLNLPPGWQLLALLGADTVRGDWLHSWSLWDFFWVLLLGLATSKLWSRKWGLWAVIVMVLLHGEDGAPQLIWFAILAMVTLTRVTPAGKVADMIRVTKWILLLVLGLISIAFIHHQIRRAIFPELYFDMDTRYYHNTNAVQSQEAPPSKRMVLKSSKSFDLPASEKDLRADVADDNSSNFYYLQGIVEMSQNQQNKPSNIQTGAGLPTWRNSAAWFKWEGSVSQGQNVTIVLIPPIISSMLCFLRILMLIPLALLLTDRKQLLPSGFKWGTAAPLALLPLILWPGGLRAGDPNPKLLEELRQRLLKPADCFPDCAVISSSRFEMKGNQLLIDLEVHAAEDVAIPLPGLPARVSRNGQPVELHYLGKTGVLWVPCPTGVNQFKLEMDASRDSLELAFPLLKPQFAEVEAEGWDVSGLLPDGTLETQLEFRRSAGNDETSQTHFEGGELAAFGSLTRQLVIDRDWYISSILTKKPGVSLVTSIPLLPGESVISSNTRVEDGKIWVNMPPAQTKFSWVSNIKPASRLTWVAPSDVPWMEIWQLDAAPEWQVTWSGSPLIGFIGADQERAPYWQPRPGEGLDLQVTLSDVIAGQTLTFDNIEVNYSFGDRTTDHDMLLSIRSSLGGDHGINLPTNAAIEEFRVDGVLEPVRQEDGQLILPLKPGRQDVSVKWSEPADSRLFWTPSQVNLNQNWVNANASHVVPGDRWLLWAGGPGLRPVVMFWSLFLLVVLVSLAAARIPGVPLKAHHWILLGLGVSQLHITGGLIVIFWFVLIARRAKSVQYQSEYFNLAQILVVFATIFFLFVLLMVLHNGLLGSPNMYITSPQSSGRGLAWYSERGQDLLPAIRIISVPMYVFRVLMLLWAFWLASSLIRWLKWGWQSFSTNGLWKKDLDFKEVEKPTSPSQSDVEAQPADTVSKDSEPEENSK